MHAPFQFAVCNELFGQEPFASVCREVKRLGYDGLEIAPFTLADDPAELGEKARSEIRKTLVDNGLAFAGLHWLLAAPVGLHATTCDAAVRERTWAHVARLIELAAVLRTEEGPVNLIFGSPQQRSTGGKMAPEQARLLFTDHLRAVAPLAEQHQVRVLVEALPQAQSDVINTLAEAAAIVDGVGSPAVATMFDVHNTADEQLPAAELLGRYRAVIRHVHVNEMDGREPGTGSFRFDLLFRSLREIGYEGWISLEVFDFSRDPAVVAGDALRFLRKELNSILI